MIVVALGVPVMQLDRPIQVITPTVDGDVLAALARADAAFTGRAVHRLVGRYSVEGVRRALERLARQGIVVVTTAGPSKLYRLNREHLAAPYVIGLAQLAEEFIGRLRGQLSGWQTQPAYAALFGSAATRQMRSDSDIDVFVVRPDSVPAGDACWSRQLDQLADDGSAWTGNDLRILEMSEADARLRLVNNDQIVGDVAAHGIRLAGPSGYLRALKPSTAGGPSHG